jgi:peptidyl-prolyl cis-trans isomerase C
MASACRHAVAPDRQTDRNARRPPVVVNGVMIPVREIAAETQNFPAFLPGEAWQQAARALVIRELLIQEARRLGIRPEPQTEEDGRHETDEDAAIRALIEREVPVPNADETTLRRYYDNNRARFRTPPLQEAEHILIAARRDDAAGFEAARAKARGLADCIADDSSRFVVLAREVSACPSAAAGGSLGQIGPGDTTPEFEAALQGLEPGEISAPIETRYGVHLIRLVRRVEGRVLPFELVRDRISEYLGASVRRRATAQYLSLLIGRAEITGIELGSSRRSSGRAGPCSDS